MRRRGFTLIELLVVVAVVAAMLTAAVLNVATGTQSARLRNAVRGVKQFSRHARAMALLKQRPFVVTVSEVWRNGDFVSTRLQIAASGGEPAGGGSGGAAGYVDVTGRTAGSAEDVGAAESLANLGEEPKEYEGVRVKVEFLADDGRSRQRERSGVSVFSNADYLLGRSAAKGGDNEKKDESGGDEEGEAVDEEQREPVSVVYETNGRCRPHLLTVYPEGGDADKGRKIRFDRFGGVHEGEDEK